ncbi:hypothetical protein SAMN05444003_1154 [Cognatiyoonia sediminum]|uniref:Uncharacterized protein n=1 Tax=Cognatiyoonia sediminum TaxID=1508389 RepID=A0A1M5N2V2_9RHOB|nr:hypothetical protein [Cognatiyoonia sediminum]SHG83755.1 hypothetical protein SAMN05444003_1154 [Cognatiyoonia sediminum]
MTRISMTFAAASLTLSLAPAAHAYQTEIDLDQIALEAGETLNVLFADHDTAPNGTCSPGLDPELALALGLTSEAGEPNPAISLSLACNAE